MVFSEYKRTNILLVVLGAIIGLAYFLLPLKLIILLVGGIFSIVFTFFALEISVGCFIVLMSIVPHALGNNPLWNNTYILLATMFYVIVFFVQVLAGKRKGLNIKDISVPLIFFVFFILYSIVISSNFGDSLRISTISLSCILFSIIIMGLITSKKNISLLLDFVCISIFMTSLYGLYQKITGVEIRAEYIDAAYASITSTRIFSSLDNPNNFAEYLVLLLPLCFTHFLNSKNELKKLAILCIFGLGTINLLFTLSRASYLAFAFGAIIYILLVNRTCFLFVLF